MQLELSEYQNGTFDVGPPTADDLRLTDELNADFERKLELRWLHNGKLEVRSQSWVGLVQLRNATIHIRPKLAGHELNLVRMIEYSAGLNRLKTSRISRTLETSSEGLLDLFCQLLADEGERLVADGLMHDYTTEEDSLPALRGSLRFREQATRRFGMLDVLECRFDEFHADVFDNQFLAAGIAAGARLCQNLAIRKRLRRLEQEIEGVTSRGPHDSGFYIERRTYTRRNERYRSAHELCLILIDRSGADDIYRTGAARSFSFLLNMNDIFEDFVAAMVEEAYRPTDWRVTASRSHRSVIRRVGDRKTYSSIIPDIVLSDGNELVPFDCKYKLYENKKLSTADVYQAFLYAYALGDTARPRAGIIYPASRDFEGPRLGVARADGPTEAEISGIAIDLPRILESRSGKAQWEDSLDRLRTAVSSVAEPQQDRRVAH